MASQEHGTGYVVVPQLFVGHSKPTCLDQCTKVGSVIDNRANERIPAIKLPRYEI